MRRMLDKKETEKLEPLIRRDILKAGALYIEYRSDDARLVIENLKSAHVKGAICLNYVSAEEFIYENEKAVGVSAKDLMGNIVFNIKATKIINAAGPWVDQIRQKDNSIKGTKDGGRGLSTSLKMTTKRLHLTKGIHLVFPYQRLP